MFSKTKVIFWVDVSLFIIFVASALTGLGLWFLLSGGRSGPEVLEVSLAYRLLKGGHEWAGMTLLTGVALHLTLHWRWLGCVAKRFWNKTSFQARLNFSLDSLSFAAFGATSLSGLMVWLGLFGGGYRGGRNPFYNLTLFSLTRSDWTDFHRWAGLLVMMVVIVHLLLHWKWIVCSIRNYTRMMRCYMTSEVSSTAN